VEQTVIEAVKEVRVFFARDCGGHAVVFLESSVSERHRPALAEQLGLVLFERHQKSVFKRRVVEQRSYSDLVIARGDLRQY